MVRAAWLMAATWSLPIRRSGNADSPSVSRENHGAPPELQMLETRNHTGIGQIRGRPLSSLQEWLPHAHSDSQPDTNGRDTSGRRQSVESADVLRDLPAILGVAVDQSEKAMPGDGPSRHHPYKGKLQIVRNVTSILVSHTVSSGLTRLVSHLQSHQYPYGDEAPEKVQPLHRNWKVESENRSHSTGTAPSWTTRSRSQSVDRAAKTVLVRWPRVVWNGF